MDEVVKLMKEILEQAQNKIWVKNKESGNVYQVTKKQYQLNKQNYELPTKEDIKKIKNISSKSQIKPKASIQPVKSVEPAKSAKTIKNIQKLIDDLFPPEQKSKKKKEKKENISISDGFKVPHVQKQYIENMLDKNQKWLESNNKNESDKQRFSVLATNLKKLISEDSSKEEKINSLTKLVQLGLIETNDHNPEKKRLKIYFSDNIVSIFDDKKTPGLLNYKSITSSRKPNQLTRDICLFAMENGIEIPIRGSGFSKVQGQFNERGTVAILDPSQKNKESAKQQYELLVQKVGKAKAQKIERCNKAAANKILEALGNNKIIRVEQVGNLGKSALSKMGIDDKKDPTDIIVYYKDKNGKEKDMKISMKIYKNINAISVKAAGIYNAGSYYLGDQAKALDDQVQQLISKNNFKEKDISPDERTKRFKNFQEDYITRYSKYMQKLTESNQGQQKLLKMWRQVHGCGTNTWTCVTNIGKETVDLRPPDYYCNPKLPFVVNYNGVKISVQFAQKGQKFLDIIVARSTDWSTPSLKFISRHRTLKPPKESKPKKSKSKTLSSQNKFRIKIIDKIFKTLQ